MQWLTSWVSEYEGKPLQKAGMLSRDQVLQFFAKSEEQFDNLEFKQLLRLSAHQGRNILDTVNDMQKEIFQSMGVQGDFGINCLAHIRQEFGTDASLLRQFYEFVQKEEMLVDEAELPEDVYRAKYEQYAQYKQAIEEKTKDLTPEQQVIFVETMMRSMAGSGQPACCAGGACASGLHPESTAPAAMTEQEQLAFFQSLSSAKPPDRAAA